MFSVQTGEIPESGYLKPYRERSSWYTDCFFVDVQGQVCLSQFISAFFTTFLFRSERWVLGVFTSSPSSDQNVMDLASGVSDRLSLWRVEARDDQQLILSFGELGVRTWLMVEPHPEIANVSRLYFGTGLDFSSRVAPEMDSQSRERKVSVLFYPFLGFHRFYARLLLWSAKVKVSR